jgi:hypothetical protein
MASSAMARMCQGWSPCRSTPNVGAAAVVDSRVREVAPSSALRLPSHSGRNRPDRRHTSE